MKSHQRQKLPVDPRLQRKLFLGALAPFLLLFVACAVYAAYLSAGYVPLLVLSGLFAGCSLLLYFSLRRVSSKITGPLVNISHVLEGVAGGDLTRRAHVRKGDELKEHAEKLNRTLTEIQARIKRARSFCQYTSGEMERMKQEKPDPSLERIADLVKSVDEALETFKT
ncbi:MAG: methyl-accepting chemotaxis protein [Spirochaetales bacterium]|nr:methyl-accepting chemotaxis protein [Spirochaetales bacterium]